MVKNIIKYIKLAPNYMYVCILAQIVTKVRNVLIQKIEKFLKIQQWE